VLCCSNFVLFSQENKTKLEQQSTHVLHYSPPFWENKTILKRLTLPPPLVHTHVGGHMRYVAEVVLLVFVVAMLLKFCYWFFVVTCFLMFFLCYFFFFFCASSI
jgi:hypothetical protein